MRIDDPKPELLQHRVAVVAAVATLCRPLETASRSPRAQCVLATAAAALDLLCAAVLSGSLRAA